MLDDAGPHEAIYEETDRIRAKLAWITDRHRDRLDGIDLRLTAIEGRLVDDEAWLVRLQVRIDRLEGR